MGTLTSQLQRFSSHERGYGNNQIGVGLRLINSPLDGSRLISRRGDRLLGSYAIPENLISKNTIINFDSGNS